MNSSRKAYNVVETNKEKEGIKMHTDCQKTVNIVVHFVAVKRDGGFKLQSILLYTLLRLSVTAVSK